MAAATNRLAAWALEAAPRRLWGFPPRLMPVIVQRLGPMRAVGWFAWNMPRYERTLKAFGAVRTHLLCTTISLINGCWYCTAGHAYALQLIYLRERDQLFPLDEDAIVELQGLDRAELRTRLASALAEAGLGEEVPWVERLFKLVAEQGSPADGDDARIAHLIRMFAVLNACGIAGSVEPDQAHDPVNRDAVLKERYRQLRTT